MDQGIQLFLYFELFSSLKEKIISCNLSRNPSWNMSQTCLIIGIVHEYLENSWPLIVRKAFFVKNCQVQDTTDQTKEFRFFLLHSLQIEFI